MQTVDTKVDRSTFTGLDDLFLHLFGHLRYHFLDTRRMDTSVLNQLVQRQTRDLATYRVERRKGDRLRRIVHNDLHTRSGLQRADITSLTTDDTTFHFVVLDMEDRHRALGCGLRSHTLDSLNNDFLRFFVCLQTRIVHDLVHIRHGCGLGFVFQSLYQLHFRFLGTHATQLL